MGRRRRSDGRRVPGGAAGARHPVHRAEPGADAQWAERVGAGVGRTPPFTTTTTTTTTTTSATSTSTTASALRQLSMNKEVPMVMMMMSNMCTASRLDS